ncbi:MAG: hypothetical protein KGL90_05240 [Burkholderiales bacterium]|nr:hypothetical protein [Burkholderiales bacterium]
MNKRNFLVHSGQALLSGSTGLLATWTPAQASAAATKASTMATGLTGTSNRSGMSHWQGLIGSEFAAVTPVQLPTTLTLLEVAPKHTHSRAPAGLEQFTLTFQGPSRRQLPAGLHTLAHGEHGGQLVYLEPTLHQDGQTRYTACFSLMV